ncbi:hypothetical protein [Alteromonas sp. AMM-1]|uniref:hypothetical protein n=1 Tax=Alteromonas sp. AMM-1 TaxID=3394233 RepID=UPI0039A6BF83
MSNLALSAERPLPDAPRVLLNSGASCVPQHYLQYAQTQCSIEQVALDCAFNDTTLIFAGQDTHGLYIQIGLIGFDTYLPVAAQPNRKIVYGRKWRIDSNVPTSELVQTIFLAIKKAREHEVRELLKIRFEHHISAPFSTHQDARLIAEQAGSLLDNEEPVSLMQFRRQVTALMRNTTYDSSPVHVLNIEQRLSQQILVDISIPGGTSPMLGDTTGTLLTLLLPEPSVNALLFALMDALIAKSDSYVREAFTYLGVHRFSHRLSVEKLSALSVHTRLADKQAPGSFQHQLKQYNFVTDAARVPNVVTPEMAGTIQARLSEFGELAGHYPTFSVQP